MVAQQRDRYEEDFRQTQLDLQALVKKIGYDSLPLNDDTLRPFLKFLWEFAQSHKQRVWTFDTPSLNPDRLYNGLLGPVKPMRKISRKLGTALLIAFSREEIDRAHPVFAAQGERVCLYFEGVWIPK